MVPKATKEATLRFGERLAQLRKAKGFTQQELGAEVGLSRRMVAYYERPSDHPPTTHLVAIARALQHSTDELLGATTAKHPSWRERDGGLERRLQQIEQLDSAEKRQIIQIIDAFIERGQLKRKARA